MTIKRLAGPEDVEKFCSDSEVAKNKERVLKGKQLGLLVEAKALIKILSNEIFKLNFLKISKTAEAVVCCRVSPG